MNAEQLSKVGSDLVRRCGTRDPFQIANALGINVMDDCENLGSLKGMYCIVKRNRLQKELVHCCLRMIGVWEPLLKIKLFSRCTR